MRVISFNAQSGNLIVELPAFPCYEVFDVPMAIFSAMQSADSPESYFNENIWGNKFEHDSHWPNLKSLLQYMGEQMWFDQPVTVHSKAGDDDTPLHVACVWGDLSAIDLLVSGGADINARGDLGATPIYNAVSFERVRSVERLLKAGATIDDDNELSTTARREMYNRENPKLIALIP